MYSHCTGLLLANCLNFFFLVPSIIYCSIKTPISICICVCIGLVCVIELHTVVCGQAVLAPYSKLLDTFSIFSIWSGHLLVCHLALSAVMSHHLSQHKTFNSAPLTRLCSGLIIPWIKVIDITDYYFFLFPFFLCILCYLSSRSMPSLSLHLLLLLHFPTLFCVSLNLCPTPSSLCSLLHFSLCLIVLSPAIRLLIFSQDELLIEYALYYLLTSPIFAVCHPCHLPSGFPWSMSLCLRVCMFELHLYFHLYHFYS